MAERRLLLAFAFSLLLHLGLLLQPLWRLPLQGEQPASPRLDARLLVPPAPKVEPQPRREPPPPKEKSRTARAKPGLPVIAQTAVQQPPAPPVAEEKAPEPTEESLQKKTVDAAAQPAAAPSLPVADVLASADRGRLEFKLTLGRQGLVVGRAIQTWSRDGERYTLGSVMETVGLAALFKTIQVTQVSEGRIAASGLVPEQFRAMRDDGENGIARFDWKAGRILLEHAGDKRELPLDPGAQDLLSFIYQLVLERPKGKAILHVATGKAYNAYQLENRGEEKLSVAGKPVTAMHYTTLGPPGEQTTEVWLAEELAWLPVRVRFTDKDGRVFEMVADSLDFGPVQQKEIPRLPGMNTP